VIVQTLITTISSKTCTEHVHNLSSAVPSTVWFVVLRDNMRGLEVLVGCSTTSTTLLHVLFSLGIGVPAIAGSGAPRGDWQTSSRCLTSDAPQIFSARRVQRSPQRSHPSRSVRDALYAPTLAGPHSRCASPRAVLGQDTIA